MTNNTSIKDLAKSLRLTLISDQIDIFLDTAAEAKMSYKEFIEFLFKQELDQRKRYQFKRGIVSAHFPFSKTIDEFDFNVIPSIDPGKIRDLTRLEWIKSGTNILFQGPPGVGKTHLAISLGRLAIENGYKVLFIQAQNLVESLVECAKNGNLKQKLSFYNKIQVLIIDELGYFPLRAEAAHVLFAVINQRYEKLSTIITCNRSVGEWGIMLGDSTAASAILDRFLHHSHVLTINGDSYRLLEKKREGILSASSHAGN